MIVTAVKEAEDGDDIIVRCFESTGRPSKATLNLAFAKTQWSGTFHPFEIKTLRVNRKTSAVREVDILEQ